MRYIDITKKKLGKKWLAKARKLTIQLNKIQDNDAKIAFIEKHQKVWKEKELETFFRELSHGKCWYTEAKDCASYLHIDHFRPKAEIKDLNGDILEGYWWLAFEWTNYRLSGSAINIPKSSKFPVRPGTDWACCPSDDIDDEEPYLLDPTKITDPGLLTFDEEGNPRPLGLNDEWNKERVNISIDILNLDFEPLVQARKQVWFKCNKEINEAINLMIAIQKQNSSSKRARLAEAVKKIKGMVSEEAPFSAVAVACVESQGVQWLNRMVFMN